MFGSPSYKGKDKLSADLIAVPLGQIYQVMFPFENL